MGIVCVGDVYTTDPAPPVMLDTLTSVCNVCGRDMGTKDGGKIVGLIINIQDHTSCGDNNFYNQFKEVYPELELPLSVEVCHVCWIKSLGVKL